MHKIHKWVDRFKNKPLPITKSNAKKALSPSDFNVFLKLIVEFQPAKPRFAIVTATTSNLLELKLPIILHNQKVKVIAQNDQIISVNFKGKHYQMLIDMIETV